MNNNTTMLIEALELIGKARNLIGTIEDDLHTQGINKADVQLVDTAYLLSECISTEIRSKHFFGERSGTGVPG